MKIKYSILFLLFVANSYLYGLPVVTNLSPNFGSDVGGNIVTITGSGFTGATSVSFGSEISPSFLLISDSEIQAIAPESRPGNVSVIVTGNGISSFSPESNYTYQGNWEAVVSSTLSGTITLIDIPSNVPSAPLSIGGIPIFGVAITPDGRTAYIARRGANDVLVFDLITNTPITTITVGDAISLVPSPDGSRIYVLTATTGTVSVISTATNTVFATIPIPLLASNDIAITPDGKKVYVSNFAGSITPIDTSTNTAGTPIPLSAGANGLAITPDGSTLYICLQLGASIVPMDIATNTVGTEIVVGGFPIDVAITPNGQTAYVTISAPDSVVPINISTNTAGAAIPMPDTPPAIAITPDGTTAYVAISSNSVIPIDIASNTAGTAIPIGGNTSQYLAITPDQAPFAFFTVTDSIFDASQSTSPTGSIVNYFWDFGDGTTLSTSSSIVSHHFPSSGFFNVTLRVTNSAGTSTTVVSNGQGVLNNGGRSAVFSQVISANPLNPANFRGSVVQNKFATQTDIINHLTWEPNNDSNVKEYIIFRDGEPIAIIPQAGPFRYNDHNRRKNTVYTYTLIAIDGNGNESPSSTIVLFTSP